MLQVFLVIGVTGGAVLSAGLSSSIGSVKGVSVPDALIGGILMLWGSRFASGCTRCVVNIELIHVFEKKTMQYGTRSNKVYFFYCYFQIRSRQLFFGDLVLSSLKTMKINNNFSESI